MEGLKQRQPTQGNLHALHLRYCGHLDWLLA